MIPTYTDNRPAPTPARIFSLLPDGYYRIALTVNGKYRDIRVRPLRGVALIHRLVTYRNWPLSDRVLQNLDQPIISATARLGGKRFLASMAASGYTGNEDSMTILSDGDDDKSLDDARKDDADHGRLRRRVYRLERRLAEENPTPEQRREIEEKLQQTKQELDVKAGFFTPEVIRVLHGKSSDTKRAKDRTRKAIERGLAELGFRDPEDGGESSGDLWIGRYFSERLFSPFTFASLDCRADGWLFRDDDASPWVTEPERITEDNADGAFKQVAGAWHVRWRGKEFSLAGLRGLGYIARILEQRTAPCALLQSPEMVASLLPVRCEKIFRPGTTLDSYVVDPLDRLFQPGSELVRYGIDPTELNISMSSVWRVYRKMVRIRAKALLDGKRKRYKDADSIVKEVEKALDFVKRRLELVAQIGDWSRDARSSVSHAVSAALDAIRTACPDLADHLDKTLSCGKVCSYDGDESFFISGLPEFPRLPEIATEALWMKSRHDAGKGRDPGDVSWALECGGAEPKSITESYEPVRPQQHDPAKCLHGVYDPTNSGVSPYCSGCIVQTAPIGVGLQRV